MNSTKKLIEDYMEEVVSQIEYIESTSDFDAQGKIKFFSDTRQSFGRSALVLQGGTALALYHIGVVKALNEQGLLPRIISGTAIGSMIAALLCIHTDEELPVNVYLGDHLNQFELNTPLFYSISFNLMVLTLQHSPIKERLGMFIL